MTCANKPVDKTDCFVMEGKMALPNTYFVGRLGSKWIISMRDNKKIRGVQCKKCDKVFIPPREHCEKCWSKIDENWVDLKNEGELVNFTVVRYFEKHLPKKPIYILAQIKLDGTDTPLTHIVMGIDPKDVQVGMRVKAVFADQAVNTLMQIDHFEPL